MIDRREIINMVPAEPGWRAVFCLSAGIDYDFLSAMANLDEHPVIGWATIRESEGYPYVTGVCLGLGDSDSGAWTDTIVVEPTQEGFVCYLEPGQTEPYGKKVEQAVAESLRAQAQTMEFERRRAIEAR